MVDRKLIPLVSAVLAGLPIPLEHVAPGQGQLLERHPNELAQPDHGRLEQLTPDHTAAIVLQAFSLSLEHHHGGPSPTCDVERLVRGVENKNLAHGALPMVVCQFRLMRAC